MLTVVEIWVFFLVAILIVATPLLLRKIYSDYTKAEVSGKSVLFGYIFFSLFIMTILNAAQYTRWVFASDNLLFKVLGYVLMSTGILIITEAFVEFRSFKRIHGLKVDKIISTGVYRFSRNPQYLATFLFIIGFSLLYRSIIAFILTPIFIILVDVFFVSGEEKYLEKSLGNEYLQYKKRVRRWL